MEKEDREAAQKLLKRHPPKPYLESSKEVFISGV